MCVNMAIEFIYFWLYLKIFASQIALAAIHFRYFVCVQHRGRDIGLLLRRMGDGISTHFI